MPIFRKHRRRNGNGSSNGNHHTEQQIGLALLGSTSAFSIWSAVNPSFFTIKAFHTPEHEKDVRFGMNAGLALNGLLAGGILLAYRRKGFWPALLTAATAVGLWVSYHHILGQAKAKEGWKSKESDENRPYNPPGVTVTHKGRWPGILAQGSGNPLHTSLGSEYEYPGSMIGHHAMQHANQPVWEHTYGQPV